MRITGAVPVFAMVVLASSWAMGDEASPCGASTITRDAVARCVIDRSASLRADRENVAASVGRRVAAAPWFPSSPTLSVTGAQRAGTEGRSSTINYTASLAQEIEIAGQRASRRRAADVEVTARSQDVIARSRRIAMIAYTAYFESLAAHEALVVAQRLEATGRQIAVVTRARADAGVVSPLDAEVAEATSLRITLARLESDHAARRADAQLASMLGRDPIASGGVAAAGDLEPLAIAESLASSLRTSSTSTATSLGTRPEVRALDLEKQSFELRAQAYRRARYPTLTLQVFAQNDGYDERVLGAGLSIPIPLPQPLGRMYTGEIAEAESLARQRAAQAEATQRDLSSDLATALAGYETHRAEAALFTPARVKRTEQLLGEIAKEIEGGRLAARDAVLAEQQLIDVLRGYVEARRELCLSSVELAHAAGVPLDGGGAK